VIPEHEAHRTRITLQLGDRVSFRVDAKAVLPLGCDPARASEEAAAK
jgi:hypothetical protein